MKQFENLSKLNASKKKTKKKNILIISLFPKGILMYFYLIYYNLKNITLTIQYIEKNFPLVFVVLLVKL